MSNAFILQDGQVYINQAYVENTKADYPVIFASDNYSFVAFSDGHVELRDAQGVLRVKTFTQASI